LIVFRSSVYRLISLICFGVSVALADGNAAAANFHHARDTFAFANATVFKYYNGIAFLRAKSTPDDRNLYTRRCFVMTRAAAQFYKFARFDPQALPIDDRALAARVRSVTRRAPWHPALPENQRIIFPGYANLREMSKVRADVLKENIGIGWPTYIRVGNFRMFFQHDPGYQEKTHAHLDAALKGGDLFIGYLSTYPSLSINHSVLVYAQKPVRSGNGDERYLVYDPNHPEAPRELSWSAKDRAFGYQKDSDFVGGFVRVYQVYGKLFQ
jgi:hypothetical protein